MADTEKNTNLRNTNAGSRTGTGIYNIEPIPRNAAKSAGKGTKKGRKKKKKNNGVLGPLIGLLFGSGTVGILLLVVLLVEFMGKSGKVNAGTFDDNSSAKHYSADEEFISIDADSFMGYVGDTYTLSLSANPVELVESAVWSSSNEDAVIVDERGNVTLVGVGVSAITATSGEYSSAVVIEVVSDASQQGNMGFNTIGQNSSNNQSSNSGNSPYEESQPTQDGNASDVNYSQNGNASSGSDTAGNNSWNNGDTDADAPQTTTTQPVTQQPDTAPETTQEPTTEFIPPTTKAAEAINTDEMFSILSNSGFSQYLPNAAIYEVDGEYYGEIIVESDSVHIYIKKRSVNFDMAVRGALAYLLPDMSESVWNVYTTLSKDKTISSDGRKVRFVMPATNAHSQIIVYNP